MTELNKNPKGNLVSTKKIQIGPNLKVGTEVSLKNSWEWMGEENGTVKDETKAKKVNDLSC